MADLRLHCTPHLLLPEVSIGPAAMPSASLTSMDQVKRKNPSLQGQALLDESRRQFNKMSKRRKKELVISGELVPVSEAQRAKFLGKNP